MASRMGLKASQRGRVRPAIAYPVSTVRIRETGEPVRWNDRKGTFRRDVGDGEHSEVVIGDRVYRVKTSELA